MSNAGYAESREAVAEVLAEASGLEVKGSHVIMTSPEIYGVEEEVARDVRDVARGIM